MANCTTRIMNEMMNSGDREKIQRVTESFLKMKKLDLEVLQKADYKETLSNQSFVSINKFSFFIDFIDNI